MQNSRTAEFEKRFISYSVRVIKLTKVHTVDLPASVIDQVIRSSTSVGANYAESQDASSKADFKNKLYIAKKEANETKYWLRVIAELTQDDNETAFLIQESQEIILIFQKIINTLNSK